MTMVKRQDVEQWVQGKDHPKSLLVVEIREKASLTRQERWVPKPLKYKSTRFDNKLSREVIERRE